MQILKNRVLLADILILISALLWGGEYVVVKDAVGYMPPNWINALRFLLASLVMMFVFIKKIKTIRRNEVLAGMLLGVFLFGGFALQTIGIQWTTASKSGFLTTTYVVIVPFIVWLLKRRFPGWKTMGCAAVCITGIALVSLEPGSLSMHTGDLLTLGAALFFSFSIMGFDYFSKRYDPVRLTFVEMFTGGLLSLAAALVSEPFPVFEPGAYEIAQLLYLVLLGSLLCHLASNIAMKWAEPSHASLLWSLESVFALIFSAVFMGERFSAGILAGFVLIFISVLMSSAQSRQEKAV